MKYLLVYDTTDGDILKLSLKSTVELSVVSGSGTIDNNVLTGTGFLAAALNHTLSVVMAGRLLRSPISAINSDTEIILGRTVDTGGPQSVTYTVCDYEDAEPFTQQEADADVAAVKIEVGHQNVSSVRLTTGQMLSKDAYYIDTADGNKLKNKSEQIVYE